LRATSLLVLLVALLATGAASWGVHAVVRDQEQRLLKERVVELNLYLTSSIQSIPSNMSAFGGILKATNGSAHAFEQAAAAAAATDPAKPTYAWLRPAPAGAGFVVLAVAGQSGGPDLSRGEVVAGPPAVTLAEALRDPNVHASAVFGLDRRLGMALGPPAAPIGTVLFRQVVLGPVQPPRAAGTAPYAELNVAIYGSARPDPSNVLVTTTKRLPMRGEVRNEALTVGGIHWLLSVKSKEPLVGNVAANAWWVTLVAGLLGSLLLAAVVETSRRRRDDALALYASEHHVAETLQRSLLPKLPTLDGLDVAARYLAGSKGQEVGGDWFDVFPVAGGGVAITVGDVIGHDLAAASAMAEIRAAVRAYAIDGDEPRSVINRLDRLVKALGLTPLATVVYGVLGPTSSDGSRTLTYTNAGHPVPLLRTPSGQVEPLSASESILIGAPMPVDHLQTEERIEPGSTLLLFTDGLIEEPGRPLEDSMSELIACFAEYGAASDVDEVCERVLGLTRGRDLRDDVAVLAIRVGVGGSHEEPHLGRLVLRD
jgi:hypothetical protein